MNITIHYEEFGHGNRLLIVTLKSALDLSALFPHPWNRIGSDRGIASYVIMFTIHRDLCGSYCPPHCTGQVIDIQTSLYGGFQNLGSPEHSQLPSLHSNTLCVLSCHELSTWGGSVYCFSAYVSFVPWDHICFEGHMGISV